MTDRERVNAVLSKLEFEKGYFARGPWWCCSNCGWHAIPEGQSDKAVFWNEQTDETAFDEYDVLRGKLFLQWAGDGAEIVQAFEEAGFQTEWDGMKETTVIVFDEVDPTFHGREVVCPECGEVESECTCDEMCSDCGEHYCDCICHEVCDGCGENLDDCACGEEG